MTREEAIEVFTELNYAYKADEYGDYFYDHGDEVCQAASVAIAALREQKERSKAEREGRVIVLPCKVGDTIYQLRNKKHAKGLGISPRIVSSACVWADGSYALCHQGMTFCQSRDLGKTWFLTQEEALRRLEEV